jgi:hypothetical protein
VLTQQPLMNLLLRFAVASATGIHLDLPACPWPSDASAAYRGAPHHALHTRHRMLIPIATSRHPAAVKLAKFSPGADCAAALELIGASLTRSVLIILHLQSVDGLACCARSFEWSCCECTQVAATRIKGSNERRRCSLATHLPH